MLLGIEVRWTGSNSLNKMHRELLRLVSVRHLDVLASGALECSKLSAIHLYLKMSLVANVVQF